MANLKIKNLQKGFEGFSIIKGIDLEVNDKEFVVFVGPSGCGKSTLLRLIAGLEEVSGGTIELDGRDITEVSPAKRDLAMVFQTYALYPHMSVRKNMSFALDLAGVAKAEVEKKVGEAARILELGPMLERKPKQLSGGQRQRVAIGRAIVRNPKIFLFDEPLSNLDAALRVQMRLELLRLHKELQATMIYVTHDQVEAMTMADKVVVLNGGKIEQVGSPLDLYHQPANLFVAGFLGTPKMGFLKGKVTRVNGQSCEVLLDAGTRITLPLSGANLSVGGAVTLGHSSGTSRTGATRRLHPASHRRCQRTLGQRHLLPRPDVFRRSADHARSRRSGQPLWRNPEPASGRRTLPFIRCRRRGADPPIARRSLIREPAMKLNKQNLNRLAPEVALPAYTLSDTRQGIAHIGVGGFHRAHQAYYTDALMNTGEALDWAICGVGLRAEDRRARDDLKEQDYLFTLFELGDADDTEVGSSAPSATCCWPKTAPRR